MIILHAKFELLTSFVQIFTFRLRQGIRTFVVNKNNKIIKSIKSGAELEISFKWGSAKKKGTLREILRLYTQDVRKI